MAEIEVRGLTDIPAALTTLDAQMKAQISADTINAGAQVVAIEMAQQAPHRSGRLSRNIETLYSIGDGIAEARIGPARDVFYGGILNQGAKAHVIKPFRYARGRRRGQGRSGGAVKKVLASPEHVFGRKINHPGVVAEPFITDALAASGPQAIAAMGRTISAGIERVAASLPRRS